MAIICEELCSNVLLIWWQADEDDVLSCIATIELSLRRTLVRLVILLGFLIVGQAINNNMGICSGRLKEYTSLHSYLTFAR